MCVFIKRMLFNVKQIYLKHFSYDSFIFAQFEINIFPTEPSRFCIYVMPIHP